MVALSYHKKLRFNYVPGNEPFILDFVGQFWTVKRARKQAKMWKETCKLLCTLPSLVELKLDFYEHHCKISETDLLQPLLSIKGLQTFEVHLPWMREDAWEPIEDENVPPFRITRKLQYADEDSLSRAYVSGHPPSRLSRVFTKAFLEIYCIYKVVKALKSSDHSWEL